MSGEPQWHFDCSSIRGARDTGDDNITSCSRFSVTVVRTVTGDKGDAVFPRCVASFFWEAGPRHIRFPRFFGNAWRISQHRRSEIEPLIEHHT